jgi:hypothetical protein
LAGAFSQPQVRLHGEQQQAVVKESPSRANNPLHGEGEFPLLGKMPTRALCAWADLSNLVLQARLSKWKKYPLTSSRKICSFGKCA